MFVFCDFFIDASYTVQELYNWTNVLDSADIDKTIVVIRNMWYENKSTQQVFIQMSRLGDEYCCNAKYKRLNFSVIISYINFQTMQSSDAIFGLL